MADSILDSQPVQQPAPAVATAPQPVQQHVYTAEEVDALKERLAQVFTEKLHKVTGGKSLEAWEKDRLEKQGEFQKLAEQYSTEAAQLRQKLQETTARAEIIRAAAIDARDDAVEVVYLLLKDKATVTDDGQVKVDGKPVNLAIKALLTEKKFLAKAAGGSGSGAPATQKATDDKQRTREWYNKASPTEIRDFFKQGGKLIEQPAASN